MRSPSKTPRRHSKSLGGRRHSSARTPSRGLGHSQGWGYSVDVSHGRWANCRGIQRKIPTYPASLGDLHVRFMKRYTQGFVVREGATSSRSRHPHASVEPIEIPNKVLLSADSALQLSRAFFPTLPRSPAPSNFPSTVETEISVQTFNVQIFSARAIPPLTQCITAHSVPGTCEPELAAAAMRWGGCTKPASSDQMPKKFGPTKCCFPSNMHITALR